MRPRAFLLQGELLGQLLALVLLSRVLRLPLRLNFMANSAALGAAAAVAIALGSRAVTRADLGGRGILALGVASMVLAAVDQILSRTLSHPIDEDMQDL